MKLLLDENFNNHILRGLLRKNPAIDLLRIQDVGLMGDKDEMILEWAAKENRVLLTHDIKTMTYYSTQRINANQPMPGVIAVDSSLPIGQAINEILLIVECATEEEVENRVVYLPL